MAQNIKHAGIKRHAASAFAAMLLLLPFAGAQAQSDWRRSPDGPPPGYSGETERRQPPSGRSDRGGRHGDNNADREQWNGRRPPLERHEREHRHERRHEHRHDGERPGHRPPPRPYPYYPAPPHPGWRPEPYQPPFYAPPVYDEEDIDEIDMAPPPQRRPARVQPERAVSPPKPPRRPVVATPPPVAPARADSGVPPAGETRMAPSEVLITVASGNDTLARDLARAQRLQLVSSRPVALAGVLLVRYRIADRRSIGAVITTLERDARVLSAQPNYLYTLSADPDASKGNLAASQYGLAQLHAGVAHLTAKGSGVLVAVIDSGVDVRHRELKAAVTRSINVSADTSGKDPSGKPPATGDKAKANTADAHGTTIAGIIAARDQMSGVAPAAQILALRAFEPEAGSKPRNAASGSSLAVVLALDAAVQGGARVVNMSFAGPRDPLLSKALAAAAAKGVVLVAAGGNDGPDAPPAWPAADPNVIAVTAINGEDQRIAVASRGDHIAVAAPGADIIGPTPGDAYQFSTGSSMAAAHVSGVAALLLQANPALTGADVRKILTETAKDLGPVGRDADYGAGLVDAAGAVNAAKQGRGQDKPHDTPQNAPAGPEQHTKPDAPQDGAPHGANTAGQNNATDTGSGTSPATAAPAAPRALSADKAGNGAAARNPAPPAQD